MRNDDLEPLERFVQTLIASNRYATGITFQVKYEFGGNFYILFYRHDRDFSRVVLSHEALSDAHLGDDTFNRDRIVGGSRNSIRAKISEAITWGSPRLTNPAVIVRCETGFTLLERYTTKLNRKFYILFARLAYTGDNTDRALLLAVSRDVQGGEVSLTFGVSRSASSPRGLVYESLTAYLKEIGAMLLKRQLDTGSMPKEPLEMIVYHNTFDQPQYQHQLAGTRLLAKENQRIERETLDFLYQNYHDVVETTMADLLEKVFCRQDLLLKRLEHLEQEKLITWVADHWQITPAGVRKYEEEALGAEPGAEQKHEVRKEWDAFICHASEDKEELVRPLAEELQKTGLRVWYDEWTLTVGDSLRKKVDEGLAASRFGVVVLSQQFFNKHWPQVELDGLAVREVGGRKVILPVWHKVTRDDVVAWSPTLAGRVAVSSDKGLETVVKELRRAMFP
jgi:hypothetical protein